MGDLHRQPVGKTRFAEFLNGSENPVGIVPDMGRNQLFFCLAASGRPEKLPLVGSGNIPQAKGNPGAACPEGVFDPRRHGVQLTVRCLGVNIRCPGLLPEKLVPRHHGDIHRRAVPVHNIQVGGRVIDIDAAVAPQVGGDTHGKGHMEDALPDFSAGHRVLVHMDVDKARGDHQAGRIDNPVRLRFFPARPDNLSLFHNKVQFPVHPVRRVNNMTAQNGRPHRHAPLSEFVIFIYFYVLLKCEGYSKIGI